MLKQLQLIFLLAVGINSNAIAAEIPSFVAKQHVGALTSYLTAHPHLRIGADPLCRCEPDLVELRKQEPGFQPYYAVGDINDDSIEDFAVGLVDSRKTTEKSSLLTVVIFHGPFSAKRTSKFFTVIRNYPVTRPLEVLYVFKTRFENGYRHRARLDLGAGIFGSDDHWVIYYDWKLKKYLVR